MISTQDEFDFLADEVLAQDKTGQIAIWTGLTKKNDSCSFWSDGTPVNMKFSYQQNVFGDGTCKSCFYNCCAMSIYVDKKRDYKQVSIVPCILPRDIAICVVDEVTTGNLTELYTTLRDSFNNFTQKSEKKFGFVTEDLALKKEQLQQLDERVSGNEIKLKSLPYLIAKVVSNHNKLTEFATFEERAEKILLTTTKKMEETKREVQMLKDQSKIEGMKRDENITRIHFQLQDHDKKLNRFIYVQKVSQKKLTEATNDLDEVEKQLAILQTKVEDHQSKIQSLSNMKDQVNMNTKQYEQLKTEQEESKSRLSKTNEELDKTRKNLETLQKKIHENDEKFKILPSIEVQVKQQANQIHSLNTSQIQTDKFITTTRKQLSDASKQVQKLSDTIEKESKKNHANIHRLETSFQDQKKTVDDLIITQAKSKKKLTQTTVDLDKTREQMGRLQNMLNEDRSKIENLLKLKDQLILHQNKFQELASDHEEAKTKLTKVIEDLDQNIKNQEKLKNKVNENNSKLEKLSILETAIIQQENKIQTISSNQDRADKILQTTTKQLNEALSQVEKLDDYVKKEGMKNVENIAQINTQLQNYGTKVDNVVNAQKESDEKLTNASNEFEKTRKELEKLEKKVKEDESKIESLPRLQNMVNLHKSKLDSITSEQEESKGKLTKTNEELGNAVKNLNILKAEVKDDRTEIKNFKVYVSEQSTKMRSLTVSLEESEKSLAETRLQLNETLTRLEKIQTWVEEHDNRVPGNKEKDKVDNPEKTSSTNYIFHWTTLAVIGCLIIIFGVTTYYTRKTSSRVTQENSVTYAVGDERVNFSSSPSANNVNAHSKGNDLY